MAEFYKPLVLVILDGVGVNIADPESTWRHAEMPTLRHLEKFFPFTTLQASGLAVGLPWGEEGNSEVGHLTIGAGRALFHHLPRIIASVRDGSFFQNKAFLEAADFVKKSSGKIHFIGLYSSGSVHAYAEHLRSLLDFAKKQSLQRVYLHIFTDGRDAQLQEGAGLIKKLEGDLIAEYPFAKIATVSGRFYAMDRDGNWERVEKVFRCLTASGGDSFKTASDYVETSYGRGITDEFVEPAFLETKEGQIDDGDAVVFYNFREDSARELASLFKPRKEIFFVTMTEYDKSFPAKAAFPPLDIEWTLAKAVSQAGMKQLHVAETEKYAHVTYFFNGGQEKPHQGEERILVASTRLAKLEDMPEMSAAKVTDTVIDGLGKYDFILVNFANGDMVGHTGSFKATARALEVLDFCVGRIISKLMDLGGAVIITADHGNAEEKFYKLSGEKRTKHTSNPVPFFVVAKEFKSENPKSDEEIYACYNVAKGVLADVAPTVLSLMGLRIPPDMNGINLLPKIK